MNSTQKAVRQMEKGLNKLVTSLVETEKEIASLTETKTVLELQIKQTQETILKLAPVKVVEEKPVVAPVKDAKGKKK